MNEREECIKIKQDIKRKIRKKGFVSLLIKHQNFLVLVRGLLKDFFEINILQMLIKDLKIFNDKFFLIAIKIIAIKFFIL